MKKKNKNLIGFIYFHLFQLMIEQQSKITNFFLCEEKSRREKSKNDIV